MNENRSVKTDFDRALAENGIALEKFGALTEQEREKLRQRAARGLHRHARDRQRLCRLAGGPRAVSAIKIGAAIHPNGCPIIVCINEYYFVTVLRRKIDRRKRITLKITNSAAHTPSTIHDFPTLCGATPTSRNIGAPKRIAHGMW